MNTNVLKTEIRSRISGELLHLTIRGGEIQKGRLDLSAAEEPLQVAAISAPRDTFYEAHLHLEKPGPEKTIAQETWIVVRGRVAVTYYDLDGLILGEAILKVGDCSITFRGGHGYCMIDDALVYEVKSGPYMGREADKITIATLRAQPPSTAERSPTLTDAHVAKIAGQE